MIRRVCVFAGSGAGASPSYAAAAGALGLALVERGLALVYGGGSIGLMGVVADAVLGAGGEATGVIPDALFEREICHEGLTDLHVVDSMHERKARMYDLSDAFVALPGGLGTFEETLEILTWSQLGLHAKPVGLLDTDAYYRELIAFLDHAVEEQFVHPRHRARLLHGTDPGDLLDAFAALPEAPGEGVLDSDTR